MSTTLLVKLLVQVFDRLGLRGAPTILNYVTRIPGVRQITGNAVLQSGQHITFPAYDPYWAKYLWGSRSYEPDVEFIFRKLAHIPEKMLLDCGANIGFWTARAKELGYQRVIAVEANPDLLEFIEENIRQNDINGQLVHAAIHEVSGETVYLQKTHQHAVSALAQTGIPVGSVTISDLVKDAPEKVIVVKLDVEGSEIPAIKGAPDREIIYLYEDWAGSGMEVTRFVLKMGLIVFGSTPDGHLRRLSSVEEALDLHRSNTNGRRQPSNFLACPPDLAAIFVVG